MRPPGTWKFAILTRPRVDCRGRFRGVQWLQQGGGPEPLRWQAGRRRARWRRRPIALRGRTENPRTVVCWPHAGPPRTALAVHRVRILDVHPRRRLGMRGRATTPQREFVAARLESQRGDARCIVGRPRDMFGDGEFTGCGSGVVDERRSPGPLARSLRKCYWADGVRDARAPEVRSVSLLRAAVTIGRRRNCTRPRWDTGRRVHRSRVGRLL